MNSRRVRIGTFNLYNLVLPGVRYHGHSVCSEDSWEKKRSWVARQLDEMNAQVIGFQEVFHDQALRSVVEASQAMSSATVLCPGADGRNPSVGLATRLELLEQVSLKDFPASARVEIEGTPLPYSEFRRPVLRATVALPGGLPCDIYVVHLKSKRPEIAEGCDPHDLLERARGKLRSLTRRAAEAVALRSLLLERRREAQHPTLVLGDLNDLGSAVTTEIVTGTPPWRRMDREEKERIAAVLLDDAWEVQARVPPAALHFTHIHNGRYECLDQILVSREFFPEERRRLGRVEFVQVFNDHLLDDTLSTLRMPRWKSDHGQVVVSLMLDSRSSGR